MNISILLAILLVLTVAGNISLFLLWHRQKSQLHRKNAELRMILDSSPAFIWFKNKNNKIILTNAPAANSIGLSRDDVEGKQTEEFYPDEAAKYLVDDLQVINSGKPKLNIVEPYQVAPGEKRWVRTDKIPYRNPTGEINGVVVFSLDVTDQKNNELALEKLAAQEKLARTEAERLSRVKDEFLVTLSHELRTPLVPILGWIDLIKGSKNREDELDKALEVIERNARSELNLVEDILDASRIVSGKMVLDIGTSEISSLVAEAVQSVELAANAKKIALSVNAPKDHIYVSGDGKRLRQILWNLLSNALKFTPEAGTITLTVAQHAGRVRISVADTGIGISKDFLPHVFERFRQEDSRYSREFGGLGLGLSLCKSLVEAHGGTISAESSGQDQGTTFTFELPIASVRSEGNSNQHTSPEPQTRLMGKRVLLIDDRKDDVEILSALLRNEAAEIKSTYSSVEALEVCKTFLPNIVICDIGMPGHDGFWFLSQLKETNATVPSIAVTAYGNKDLYSKCLAAGFKDCLVKPVPLANLVQSILAYS